MKKVVVDGLAEGRKRLDERQLCYKNVFSSENTFVSGVLEDLANFCKANESSFHPDPRVHSLIEGRREVWLRLREHLDLTPDELWEKRKPKGKGKVDA